MAFPAGAQPDWTLHSEDFFEYYSLNGKWYRKRYPESGTFGYGAAYGNRVLDIIFSDKDMSRPFHQIVLQAGFDVHEDTHCHFSITKQDGSLVQKAQFEDVSGLVFWGDGGTESQHWDRGNFGTTHFNLAEENASRRLKAGQPQMLRMNILRVGADKVVIAWNYYTYIVTDNILCTYHAKMNVPESISNIKSVSLSLSNGYFNDGRVSVEVY